MPGSRYGVHFTSLLIVLLGLSIAPARMFAQCPVITVDPPTIPQATIGTPYSVIFTQAGGTVPVTYAATGSLPSGFALNPMTGELSGTTSQRGNFNFTVTVTDANTCTGSRDYTLRVNCGTELLPQSIPTGGQGVMYSQTFSQTGAVGTVVFSLTGTLPAGMTFTPGTATLSGTPGEHGTFPINVYVSDSNGCNRTRKYDLIISSPQGTAAVGLAVDPAGNRVFEPGETVNFQPTWLNNARGTIPSLTGTMSNWTGPAGATYTIFDASANYGSVAAGASISCAGTFDCYSIGTDNPAVRPMMHWDGTLLETLSNTDSKTWTVHLGRSFTDVLTTSPFYRFIETLLHLGITGGCGGTSYCPTNPTTREQMAVFVLVAKEGAGFSPPACTTPMFNDVPASSGFCRWIEELARRGVVAGCGGGNYCPTDPVTRQQMAVFVLATWEGSGFNPPPATGVFADVPASDPFAKWIEELYLRGVVAGCGGGNYCPTDPVTREQMAVFLTQTFGLTLYRQ